MTERLWRNNAPVLILTGAGQREKEGSQWQRVRRETLFVKLYGLQMQHFFCTIFDPNNFLLDCLKFYHKLFSQWTRLTALNI